MTLAYKLAVTLIVLLLSVYALKQVGNLLTDIASQTASTISNPERN